MPTLRFAVVVASAAFATMAAACGSHVVADADAASASASSTAGGGDGGSGGPTNTAATSGTTGGGGSVGDPGGRYWTIAPHAVSLSANNCSVTEGQTAFVHVLMGLNSSCELPGPAQAEVVSPGLVRVSAWLWTQHGADCVQIDGEAFLDVPVTGMTSGTWSIEDETGGAATSIFVQGPPPPTTCVDPGDSGAQCLVDCDCNAGLVCAPYSGDIVCMANCGRPCSGDLDCGSGQEVCVASNHVTPFCEPRVDGECDVAGDCPVGMACETPDTGPSFCEWQPIISAESRHACTDDAECAAPLVCVEGDNGKRVCQLPCFSPNMRCPSAHACVPETSYLGSSAHWVCEWLGE